MASKAKYHLHCEERIDHPNKVTHREKYIEEMWGDVLIVKGKSAAATHGLVTKQLASTGSPTWQSEVKWYGENCNLNSSKDFESMKPGVPRPQYWSIWCLTSDAGSDVQALRDHVLWTLACIPWVLAWEFKCSLHQVPSLSLLPHHNCANR